MSQTQLVTHFVTHVPVYLLNNNFSNAPRVDGDTQSRYRRATPATGRSTTETPREHFPHCCTKAGAFKHDGRREPCDSFTARCKTNPNLPALLPLALSCSVCLRSSEENASDDVCTVRTINDPCCLSTSLCVRRIAWRENAILSVPQCYLIIVHEKKNFSCP